MSSTDHYSAKEDLQRILDPFENSENFEAVLYRIYVVKKVEQGLSDLETNNIVPDDEMARFWQQWSIART